MMDSLCYSVVAGVKTLWRGPQLEELAWSEIPGASEYLVRSIKYGVRDMNFVPFTEGRVLPPITQKEVEKAFDGRVLGEGLRCSVYGELKEEYVSLRIRRAIIIS